MESDKLGFLTILLTVCLEVGVAATFFIAPQQSICYMLEYIL